MNRSLRILITASLLMISGISQAHPAWGRHYSGHNPYGWVAPIVIGGAVGYVIATRSQTVVQPPPNIYYQTQPQAPIGYHYENILDANCNCYRLVLVQN
jgi:hypothetical protein